MTETIIFEHAFMIDGTGAEPLPDVSLVVENGLIREIKSGGKRAKVPEGRVIDLKGKTLMPGLIDAHVHPGNVEWFLSRTAALPPAVYVHRVTRTLETDLALGFTTLRDAGGLDEGFRAAVEQGFIKGPRLLLSVTPLSRPEGTGGKGPSPRNSLGICPEVCDGADDMRAAVRRTIRRGADQIKVFADGEVVSQSESDRARPGQPKFSVEELRAAVREAEEAVKYVMAHTYGPKAIQNCLEAGVRSIEHGNFIDAETAQMTAQKGAFYVPTLTIYDLLTGEGRDELDARTLEKLKIVGHRGIEALETAYRAGVNIASGTDIIGPLQHLKGRELAIKAEVLGPMGAIVSTTRTNAELMGLSERIGTLESGKVADLIVLDGNPLKDMTLFESGLERVLLVMKQGRIMKEMGL
ncbi:MAG: amidohydrolase family protein [Deltaproteobacteria bacterium]|nr:amidohydrolase family protein [Deltaproteobacteria bacterium]